MSVRTLIEIAADNSWDHARELKETLDKLGFEPKQTVAESMWLRDLCDAVREKGFDPHQLVDERRIARMAEDAARHSD